MSRSKILVADDSRTIRTLVKQVLVDAGFEVITAENGLEALQQVKRECPQLIILDIEMPEMDGYEVCQQLKRMGKPWDELPILFVTNVMAQALDLLGTQMGAYLRKPVRCKALLEAVNSFVQPDEALGGPTPSQMLVR